MKNLFFFLFVVSCFPSFGQTFNTYLVHDEEGLEYVELQTVQTLEGTLLSTIYYGEPGVGSRVIVMRSDDKGITWNKTLTLDTVNYYYDPSIAVDENNIIYVTCMRSTLNTVIPIYRSFDDGETFEFISFAVPEFESDFPDKPYIFCRGEKIYLTYSDFHYGLEGDVFTTNKISEDEALSWPSTYAFDDIEETSTGGSSLAFGFENKLITTYGDYNTDKTFLRISEDEGLTYSDPIELENNPAPGYNQMTQIITHAESSYLGVLINIAHTAAPLIYTFSNDNGSTWQTTEIDASAVAPAGFLNTDGVLHFIFNHINGSNFEFHYATSIDSGATINFDIILYSDSGLSFFTSFGEYQSIIKGDDAKLHATWIDYVNNSVNHTVIDIGEMPIDTTEEDTTIIDTTSFIFNSILQEFRILPNPVTNQFILYSNTIIEDCEILFYTIYGSLIRKEKRNLSEREVFNVENFSKGVYILEIANEAYRKKVKFNVQ